MTALVFVHGWGFDAGFWDPVRESLGHPHTLAADLGFRGEPLMPEWPGDGIAVGHSLGLLWLLKTRPFPWRALVAVNGFTRFPKGAGFEAGVPPRLIERMIAKAEGDHAAVAADFLARCGLPEAETEDLHRDALIEGLQWLSEWDCRGCAAPLVALAGRRDPIATPAMTLSCFPPDRIRWREDGGHLLPLTHPGWCADMIRDTLHALQQ
jgi:pimeloyl-[acyl-carrier protein] methyl ester esterase